MGVKRVYDLCAAAWAVIAAGLVLAGIIAPEWLLVPGAMLALAMLGG